MNNQMSVSVTAYGHLTLSRLQGADTELLCFSIEHLSSLRDRST